MSGGVIAGGKSRRAVPYSESIRAKMIMRMTGPNPMTARAVERETGITQPTLSRWLREAGRLKAVSTGESTPPSKRTQDWTAQERLQAVLDAAAMSEDELGAFLRRTGLHREQLELWRKQALEAAASALDESEQRKRGGATVENRRVRELQRELHRKEKALAEVTALLVLKKKADAIFGDEEDDTDPRSDE